MTDLQALSAANARRWSAMAILPQWSSLIDHVAHRLVNPIAKGHYATVSKITGVPWQVIAVIHEREASQSWAANIAQGDPWNRASVHVPQGRGPFQGWDFAAVDALQNCSPFAARWHDWTAGGALCLLEQYNGLGYARMGVPSPYIWASTDQYHSGKYVADHHYDPDVVDHQLGCAALIHRMIELDPSADFGELHP